jgi:hypothetical protein
MASNGRTRKNAIMPQSEPDVLVENHGSVCIVQPMSEAAREWIDENVQTEGWQWIGGGLAVEPRCVENLVNGVMEAGLTVA